MIAESPEFIRGEYVKIAFDPSFTGESAGEPRNTTSPDINTEDFSAAVDNDKTAEQIRKERMDARKKISEQRTIDYKNGTYAMAGGVPTEISNDTPQFVKDYNSFYQTKRGYHPISFGSTTGATLTSLLDFVNYPRLKARAYPFL